MQCRNLEAGADLSPWRNTAYGLSSHGLCSLLPLTAQPHLLRYDPFFISINNQESAVPTGSQASLMEAVLVDSRFQSFLSPSVGLVFGVYSFTGLILRLGTPVSLYNT